MNSKNQVYPLYLPLIEMKPLDFATVLTEAVKVTSQQGQTSTVSTVIPFTVEGSSCSILKCTATSWRYASAYVCFLLCWNPGILMAKYYVD